MSEPPASDRRQLDRRRQDRRRHPRDEAPAPAESWFGAVGMLTPEELADEALRGDAELPFDPDGSRDDDRSEGEPDSRFLSRQARRIVSSGSTAFERIYAAFVAARAAVGLALLFAQGVAEAVGVRPPSLVVLLCVAYGVQSIALWLLPRLQWRGERAAPMTRLNTSRWLAIIGVDLLCFGALHLFAPGSGPNSFALLVLPVLTAGVLTPRLLALATAASVTLLLLSTAWLGVLAGGDTTLLMTQAGLAGSGFFVITLLAGELAGRLAREELTARGSLEMARQQAQLNRLVIEEMQEGVLVVDRRGRVRAANPAARALIAPTGMALPAPFRLRGITAWEPLVRVVQRAFREASWPEEGRDVPLHFGPDLGRTLRVRVRFTRRRDPPASEEFCVLFLEDVRAAQARTRQEKLAAMGRMSAGIAHEIRNPLAAIAQANALLAEDALAPAQRQLTQMVTDNVERLKRLVDDVMEVAPGQRQPVGSLDATQRVGEICLEWAAMEQWNVDAIGSDAELQIDLPRQPCGVAFDADHLRRVLVNLLDNAQRHAGRQPGAIVLRLSVRDEQSALLSVSSAGAPIEPEVERFLFEPFFSTRSRGTGLGLYICRELCERCGARIEYQRSTVDAGRRNEFVVLMRRAAL